MSELRTLVEDDGAAHRSVVVLDQTKLPQETGFVRLTTLADAVHAIRVMQVRGAPLIGATAAYGVALGLAEGIPLDTVIATLAATRPTAVNLHWALARMNRVLQKSALASVANERREMAWNEARAIAREDAAANAAIGQHGLPLLREIGERKGRVEVMTHCNAGWLATVAHGTALSPIYAAQAAGLDVHVWVSETRPRNQGLLTAWELAQAGVPHTFIVDSAAGYLMMQGKVDCVIVGADRIAANGDVANKVGTYALAVAAAHHGLPFCVAAPASTIDAHTPDGASIPIEHRSADEVRRLGDRQLAPANAAVHNPAFDVTPAALVTAIVTDTGIVRPPYHFTP